MTDTLRYVVPGGTWLERITDDGHHDGIKSTRRVLYTLDDVETDELTRTQILAMAAVGRSINECIVFKLHYTNWIN